MTSPIIALDNVSKRYARSHAAQRRLMRAAMLREMSGLARTHRPELRPGEFWALDTVSMHVEAGEAVGLIGPNGAGKSTLMRMIARMISPDFGRAMTRAPVSKLISLSAEFQPNLSGRENVYLVGAVRGMSRKAIRRQFDSIVDFSEIGDFIDAPFSSYSQGMRLRLAFAVAVHAQSPIMLIDEVLAVGDIRFRQKCLRKLTELKRSTTYILASHSYGYIAQFCERSVVVEGGRILFDGSTREAIEFAQRGDGQTESNVLVGTAGEMRLGRVQNENALSGVEAFWIDRRGEPVQFTNLGAPLRFRARFRLMRPINEAINVHVQLAGLEVQTLLSFSNRSSGFAIEADAGEWVTLTAGLGDLSLRSGTHGCAISVFDGPELLFRSDLPPLIVEGRGRSIWGEVQVRPSWTLERSGAVVPENTDPTGEAG